MVATERALATIPEFHALDVYDSPDADLYPDWLGTISAGFKGADGKPVVSRDGTIYVTGTERAPGLVEALAERGNRRLTVTFPSDDPRMIVRQHFAAYTATKLLAYGDATRMVVITDKGHERIPAGTPAYDEWRAKCKVSTSILFSLARWDGDEPVALYPDGFGPYRIRTTSRNSVRSVLSALRACAAFTGGYIAGVPFEIMIDYRDVTGPQGDRRKVPVWAFAALKGVEITSRRLRGIMTGALTTGSAIRLLAPPEDLGGLAFADFDESGDTDDDAMLRLDELQKGGACDPADYRGQWFQAAKGTPLGDKESPARAEFIARHCREQRLPLTSSLSEFLKHATDAQALTLIAALTAHIATGELPISDVDYADIEPERDYEHELAAEQRAESRAEARKAAASADTFDPAVVKPWFVNAVKAKGAAGKVTVTWDAGRAIGDLLSSVLQSMGAGIDITRYLVDNPKATFESLTFAEELYLRKLADRPGAREQLMAVHALAAPWLKEQKAPKAESAVLV